MTTSVSMEDFEALLNESLELETPKEGSVVKGTIIAIEAGQAIIDIGYKMEGRIDLREFSIPGQDPEVKVDTEQFLADFLKEAGTSRKTDGPSKND